jgi:ribonuclease P protein component
MLSSKYRFHGYGALKFLFGHGRTYRFKSVSIRAAHNPRRTISRVAVVISKKVIKSSPKRNQVRRRIYEVLRVHWDEIVPSHDILISVYDPNFLDIPHEQLTQELQHALDDAHLLIDARSK